MYYLEYYYCDVRSARYEMQAGDDVVTLGSGECHYPLPSDSTIASVHMLIRFNGNYFEICPVATVWLGDKSLKINEWSALPFGAKIIVTPQSYIMLRGGRNPGPLAMYFDETPIPLTSQDTENLPTGNLGGSELQAPPLDQYPPIASAIDGLEPSELQAPPLDQYPPIAGAIDGLEPSELQAPPLDQYPPIAGVIDGLEPSELQTPAQHLSNNEQNRGLLELSPSTPSPKIKKSLATTQRNPALAAVPQKHSKRTAEIPIISPQDKAQIASAKSNKAQIHSAGQTGSETAQTSSSILSLPPKDALSEQEEREIAEIIAKSQLSEQEELQIDKIIQKSQIAKKQLGNLLGKTIGQYQIIKGLGSGAMGDVYEAQDIKLKRKIALKILKNTQSLRAVKRFLREAKILAKLRHPHIVQVHDLGEYMGYPYFVMDLLKGETLKAKITNNPISSRQAMTWAGQIAQALETAHRANVIHRDLKPTNIMIENGQAILMDFGIAKDSSEFAQLTTTGETLGTPTYMSPEQATGNTKNITTSTDIYSLGAVLYELLTGKPPFTGTPIQILAQVCKDEPIPMQKLNPELSQDVITITSKAMMKEIKERYATISQMAHDIQSYLNGEQIQAKLPPIWTNWRRALRQYRKLVIPTICIFTIILGIWLWIAIASWIASSARSQQMELYLAEAEAIRNRANARTSAHELWSMREKYTQAQILGATSEQTMPGKIDSLLHTAQSAIQRKNWDFAQALYKQADDMQKQLNQPEYTRKVQKCMAEFEQFQNDTKAKQYNLAYNFIYGHNKNKLYANTTALKKDIALSLLQFPLALPSLLQEYVNSDDVVMSSAIQLAYNTRYKPEIVTDWDDTEQEMFKLIPYGQNNSMLLGELLVNGLGKAEDRARIFSTRMIGLIQYKEALPILVERIQLEHVTSIQQLTLQTILTLEGGPEFLLEKVAISKTKQGEVSPQKLSQCGLLALPILIRVLEKSDLPNTELIEAFQFLGNESTTSLVSTLENLNTTSQQLAEMPSSEDEENASRLLNNLKYRLKIIEVLKTLPTSHEMFQIMTKKFLNNTPEIQLSYLDLLANHYLKNDQYHTEALPILQQVIQENIPENTELQSIHIKIKQLALQGLAKIDKAEHWVLFIHALQSPIPEISQTAFDILQKLPPSANSIILQEYQKSSGPLRKKLLEILAIRKCEHVVSIAVKSFLDGNSEDMEFSQRLLLSLGSSAIPSLQSEYHKNNNPAVQLRIIKIIAQIYDTSNLGFYQIILPKANKDITQEILQTLPKYESKSIPLLINMLSTLSYGEKTGFLAETCAKVGSPTVGPLLQNLDKIKSEYRPNFSKALISIGEPAIDPIIKKIQQLEYSIQQSKNDKDVEMKFTLIRILTTMDMSSSAISDKAIPFLLKCLCDKQEGIGAEVKQTLLANRKYLAPYIIKELEQQKTKTSKQYFQDLLDLAGSTQDDRLLPILYTILENREFQNSAANAIMRYDMPKILPDLLVESSKNSKRQQGIKLIMTKLKADPVAKLFTAYLDTKSIEDPSCVYIPPLLVGFKDEKKVKDILNRLANSQNKSVQLAVNSIFQEMGEDILDQVVKAYFENPTTTAYQEAIKKNPEKATTHLIKYFALDPNARSASLLGLLNDHFSEKQREIFVRQLASSMKSFNNPAKIKALDIFSSLRATYVMSTIRSYTTYPDKTVRDKAILIMESLKK